LLGLGLATSSVVLADELPQNTYLRFTAGAGFPQNLAVKDRNYAADGIIDGNQQGTAPGKLNRSPISPVVGLGAGYNLTNYLRVEALVGYESGYSVRGKDDHPANAQLDDPGGVTAAKGDLNVWTYMLGASVDLPVQLGPVQPFLTGAVGGATIGTFALHLTDRGLPTSVKGTNATGFAYQFGAGIAYPLVTGQVIELAYLRQDDGAILYPAQTLTVGGIPQTSSGLKGRLVANLATASVRFRF